MGQELEVSKMSIRKAIRHKQTQIIRNGYKIMDKGQSKLSHVGGVKQIKNVGTEDSFDSARFMPMMLPRDTFISSVVKARAQIPNNCIDFIDHWFIAF